MNDEDRGKSAVISPRADQRPHSDHIPLTDPP